MPKRSFNVMDVGASRIVCAQGFCDPDTESLSIQYAVSMQTQGLHRARITNKSQFEKSILRVVRALEQSSKKKFQDIFVNFSSTHTTSHTVAVQQKQKNVISIKSIIELSQGVLAHIPHTHQLLHVIPLTYAVDSYDGVYDPRGMRGEVLSGKFHAITTPKSEIEPFMQAFFDCHLNVDACVSTPFASGIASSAVDERNIGVLTIDLGADFTHISAFYKGQCIHTASLPIGGRHITNDISYVLGCSLEDAEKIKRLHGSALPRTHAQTLIQLDTHTSRSDGSTLQVEAPHLVKIMRARLEEIFQTIKRHLSSHKLLTQPLRRAVLSGGVSHIPRIKDLASQTLDIPVRIGVLKTTQTLPPQQEDSLNLTTAAGLLRLKGMEHSQSHIFLQQKKSMSRRIKDLFSKKGKVF